jgi:hypothetical protein
MEEKVLGVTSKNQENHIKAIEPIKKKEPHPSEEQVKMISKRRLIYKKGSRKCPPKNKNTIS